MKETNSQPKDNQNEICNPEGGYDRAILLIQGQVQLLWLIFGAFLLSETVLIGAITALDKNVSNCMILGGSIFGLLLSFLWWTTFQYNHAFYTLRIFEAKKFEPNNGKFFAEGEEIFNGETILDVKIPKYVKVFRPKIALRILIILYAIIFILIGLDSCLWICNNR